MTTLHRLRFVVPALLLCFTLGLAACESEEPNTGTTVEDITDPDTDMDDGLGDGLLGARDLYEDYNPYVGQTVTVSGEIAGVYGTNSFLIGEDLWGEDLLVVVPQDASISGMTADGMAVSGFGDLGTEYVVQVTGTVRQYVLTEVETEYGLDLVPEIETEVEEQEPMIVASSIRVMTEDMADEMADDDEY